MNTKTEMRKFIARKLIELRGDSRQKDIAEKLQMKICTYKSYEEARAQPSFLTLRKLVKIYGLLSIEEILG